MTARYVKSDPIDGQDLKLLLNNYDRELTPLVEQIAALKPVEALATSGTCENLAAMCTALYGSTEGVIERDPLNKLVSKLLESRTKDRAEYKGLDDQRKDQIIAGALLVNELFRRLNLERMTVCKSALREGILVDYLSRHLPELSIRREVPDPRRRSVLDLARRCDWHQTHAEQVARICLQLFDQLKVLHGVPKKSRELIEYAALLHDIGWHISRDQHHKHGMYLIVHGNLKGFTPEDVQIMANIVRYHRKSGPKTSHESFAELSGKAKKVVRTGAALLRIADGLDRSHCSVVSSVSCSVHRRKVDVTIKARGDAELEIWGGRRKMDLFADTFGRSLSFHEAE
jgi:exopolyphosphatase/guanosine-5'-triphosphate,3'-diphosphate pyrophosphatase